MGECNQNSKKSWIQIGNIGINGERIFYICAYCVRKYMYEYERMNKMKMKLWTKIYIITLGVFLILINIGFYTVFNMTYKKDMKSEQNIAEASFEIINSSLQESMDEMYEDGRLTSSSLPIMVEILEKRYLKQNINLMLYSDEEIIYSKDSIPMDKSLFKEGKVLMISRVEDGLPVIYITRVITDYSKNYYFCYYKPLFELNENWEELQNKYLMMSAGFSVVLALILLIVLNRLMKPIKDLSKVMDRVKKEGYDEPIHVEVKGHDDVAGLGESFNEMTDIIADNIKAIRLESERKQQFVDNFAHELKSPLTSIYGFAEYVSKANVSDNEKVECMQFIMDESSRMLEMAYDLMDLSEIRNRELKMDTFLVEDFKNEIETILKERLVKKNIQLNFETSISKLYGNKGLLKSLVGNIIINGINASEPDKKINIIMSQENYMSKLVVKDFGCGMSEEELIHIFEPFYRVDKARSRKNGSTGLGLSVCKQIVEAHNGRIEYISKKGEGTTAIIYLPVSKAKKEIDV